LLVLEVSSYLRHRLELLFVGIEYLAQLKNLEMNPKDGICLYPYSNDRIF